MPTESTITTKTDLQGKPASVSASDWYNAVEYVCDQCSKHFDDMLAALSEGGEVELWAVTLAQAMLAGDSQKRDEAQIDLGKRIAAYARTRVAAWDSRDWQRYYEDTGREDPNAWPSDETLGIPVNGWRNQ